MRSSDSDIRNAVVQLGKAKSSLIDGAARLAGSSGDFDRAQSLMDSARTADSLARGLSSLLAGSAGGPSRSSVSVAPRPERRQSVYYRDEDHMLAKLGRKRNGGIYKHRLMRCSFNTIIDELNSLIPQSVNAKELIDNSDRPANEVRIVLDVLVQRQLMTKPRRGEYEFLDAAQPRLIAGDIWGGLPRLLTPTTS
jgi:hypothetical protein